MTFIGGKLSLKGDKKKKKGAKKKSKKTKHSLDDTADTTSAATTTADTLNDDDDDLTAAEKKTLKRKMEREKLELEKVARKSHRERIEEFNDKLGSLTELNDIPRVSAAGNG